MARQSHRGPELLSLFSSGPGLQGCCSGRGRCMPPGSAPAAGAPPLFRYAPLRLAPLARPAAITLRRVFDRPFSFGHFVPLPYWWPSSLCRFWGQPAPAELRPPCWLCGSEPRCGCNSFICPPPLPQLEKSPSASPSPLLPAIYGPWHMLQCVYFIRGLVHFKLGAQFPSLFPFVARNCGTVHRAIATFIK